MDHTSKVSFAPTGTSPNRPKPASRADIQDIAQWLAKYNQATDPGITASYLFPSETEIRLVHLDNNSPASESEETIAPFYFGPDRAGGVPYPSAIALIRPEEKERLPLPEGWGGWEAATPILREEG